MKRTLDTLCNAMTIVILSAIVLLQRWPGEWTKVVQAFCFVGLAGLVAAGLVIASDRFAKALTRIRLVVPGAAIYSGVAFLVYCFVFSLSYDAITGANGGVVQISNGTPVQLKELWEFLYFAIITGSTTGYGDMLPVGLARAIVCCQIIFIPVGLGAAAETLLATARTHQRAQQEIERHLHSDKRT